MMPGEASNKIGLLEFELRTVSGKWTMTGAKSVIILFFGVKVLGVLRQSCSYIDKMSHCCSQSKIETILGSIIFTLIWLAYC